MTPPIDDAKPTKEATTPLSLRIPVRSKKALQHWCIDHDMELTAAVVWAVDQLVAGRTKSPPKPPKPPRRRKP